MPHDQKTGGSSRHSRSLQPGSSHSRKPSLSRKRSSQRLIRTISIESLEYATDNTSDSFTGISIGDTLDKDDALLPNLSSLRIASGSEHGTTTDYIEIPYVKAILDPTMPQDYLKDDIINIAHTLKIPKWYNRGSAESNLNRDFLKLSKISGAMTNAIFKIEYPKLPSLLLRVYGQSNNTIIDRDYELQVLARLSVRNIGPSLYGCFENGRFEQFLENAKTLTKDDIRDWHTSQRIARRMKELHCGVPLLRSEIEAVPACWQKIDKWLNIIQTTGHNWISNNKNIREVFYSKDWVTFRETIDKYRTWLLNNPNDNHQVFCHNDAQYGNLLFNSPVIPSSGSESSLLAPPTLRSTSSQSLFPSNSKVEVNEIINPSRQQQSQDSKLVVIDFEYAGANPAAYDLANHLSEWTYDYSGEEPWRCYHDRYPDKEQLLNFLYSYVSHLKRKDKIQETIDEEVKFYYNNIIRWRATVQLFWSLWGIVQSGELEKEDTAEGTKINERVGPNGEKYIIKVASNSDEELDSIELEEPTDGVSIDTFNYLKYSSDKISVFWGDLINLGIADKTICMSTTIKYLDTEFI